MQDLEAKLFTLERVSFCHCNTAILFFLYTLQFDTLCQMSDLSLVKEISSFFLKFLRFD